MLALKVGGGKSDSLISRAVAHYPHNHRIDQVGEERFSSFTLLMYLPFCEVTQLFHSRFMTEMSLRRHRNNPERARQRDACRAVFRLRISRQTA